MILDKLVEKKDIYAYIQFRIATLKRQMRNDIRAQPKSHREFIRGKFKGRTEELEMLDVVLRMNIREKSKQLATQLKKL